MNRREKVLAGVVGAVFTAWIGQYLFASLLQGPLDARRAKIRSAQDQLEDKDLIIARAKEATAQLRRWEQQSLPRDAELARSAYQNWLLQLVETAGFEGSHVDSREIAGDPEVYQRIPFTVRGDGTLAQLTEFLQTFYRADHLHLIQRLSVTPRSNSQLLDLSMTIEAVVLPGAERQEQLSRELSDRLVSDSTGYYQPIVARNLFGIGGGGYDAADFAFLTAILDVDGSAEIWLTVRTTGEVLKLHHGQTFEVGQFRGTVSDVDTQDIVIDSGHERWLLSLGENLSQATALPPEF